MADAKQLIIGGLVFLLLGLSVFFLGQPTPPNVPGAMKIDTRADTPTKCVEMSGDKCALTITLKPVHQDGWTYYYRMEANKKFNFEASLDLKDVSWSKKTSALSFISKPATFTRMNISETNRVIEEKIVQAEVKEYDENLTEKIVLQNKTEYAEKNITTTKEVLRMGVMAEAPMDTKSSRTWLVGMTITPERDAQGRIVLSSRSFGFWLTNKKTGEKVWVDPDIDACQTLSSANTVYTLNTSVAINGSTCLTISASNITLDCAGYSITGNNTTSTYGVYSSQFNTTIKNCIISNFSEGIRYSGATDGTIYNNTISITFEGGNATRITSNSHRANITFNTINNGNASAFVIDGGYNSTIDCQGAQITTINSSNLASIYEYYQSNITVKNCNLNTTHNGVYLNGGNYHTILNNSLYSSSGAAIYTVGADSILVANNTATASLAGRGMFTWGSQYSTFANNTFSTNGTSNALYAINIRNSTFFGNSVTSVGEIAFGTDILRYVNVTNNTVTSSAGIAHSLRDVHNSKYSNNTFIGKTSAVYVTTFPNTNNSFTNNMFWSNTSNTLTDAGTGYLNNTNFTNNSFTSISGIAILLSSQTYNILFLHNNITAPVWVSNSNNTNSFNDSTTGNIYYYLNGSGVWLYQSWTGQPWATGGTPLPVNVTNFPSF